MKCSKCGYGNDNKTKFCSNCGNRLIISEKDNEKNADDNSKQELSTAAKLIWAFVFSTIALFLISKFFGKFILEFLIRQCAFFFGCI